jgi:hypothetical protein
MRGPSALLSAATLVPSSADLNQEAAQSVTEGIGWKHQTTLPPRGQSPGRVDRGECKGVVQVNMASPPAIRLSNRARAIPVPARFRTNRWRSGSR